jgi:hypothetical protein
MHSAYEGCVIHAVATAAPSGPAMTRVYGGLKDQDRIFTNLYGEKVRRSPGNAPLIGMIRHAHLCWGQSF